MPNLQLIHIIGTSTKATLGPYVMVNSGSLGIPTIALVDMGADANIVSYAKWVKLGKPHLCMAHMILTGFRRTQSYDACQL